jgi:hypothetical protein
VFVWLAVLSLIGVYVWGVEACCSDIRTCGCVYLFLRLLVWQPVHPHCLVCVRTVHTSFSFVGCWKMQCAFTLAHHIRSFAFAVGALTVCIELAFCPHHISEGSRGATEVLWGIGGVDFDGFFGFLSRWCRVWGLLHRAGYPSPRGVARDSSSETYPKSAQSVVYCSQAVVSGGAGYPFPRRMARESSPDTYHKSAPSAAFCVGIVVSGVAFPWGWLDKTNQKPTRNQPQVLRIAVNSLIDVISGTKRCNNLTSLGWCCPASNAGPHLGRAYTQGQVSGRPK